MTLPHEMVDKVRAKLTSGEYASESDPHYLCRWHPVRLRQDRRGPRHRQERDGQRWPWQSKDWVASFNRRSLVEGLNAQIRYQSLNVNRGFFRMTRTRGTRRPRQD